jgi:ferredoxin-thioredoxin reductase catalytic subunit
MPWAVQPVEQALNKYGNELQPKPDMALNNVVSSLSLNRRVRRRYQCPTSHAKHTSDIDRRLILLPGYLNYSVT